MSMRSIGVVLREMESLAKSAFPQAMKEAAKRVLEAELAEIVKVAEEALSQGSLTGVQPVAAPAEAPAAAPPLPGKAK